jgi:hypothetical protein
MSALDQDGQQSRPISTALPRGCHRGCTMQPFAKIYRHDSDLPADALIRAGLPGAIYCLAGSTLVRCRTGHEHHRE